MSPMGEPAPLRTQSETALACVTLVTTAIHAAGEGYYHWRWGQTIAALAPDIVAVTLMLVAATRSLSIGRASAAGLLAAAWAFLTCLAYRATTERLLAAAAAPEHSNGEPRAVVGILAVSAGFCALVLLWALLLAWRQTTAVAVEGADKQ